jgi:uncharacterized protein YbjT (DUF2867 family)
MTRILVTGATGLQGGAVVGQLRMRGLRVRAMVRDASGAAAGVLSEAGCELCEADFDRPDTLRPALTGVSAAFLVLPLSPGQLELQRGRAFIEEAERAGLSYLVYSSALDARHPTGVEHFDSKFTLQRQLAESRLEHLVLGPGGFMDNLLFPQTWQGLAKGKLVTPFRPEVKQALVSVEDIGRCAAACLAEPGLGGPAGSFVPLWADHLDGHEQAEIIADVMRRPVRASRMPWLMTRIFLGRQLTGMFDYFNRQDTPVIPDNQAFLQVVREPLKFRQWLQRQAGPA